MTDTQTFEPKMINRFVVEFPGIPSYTIKSYMFVSGIVSYA